MGDPRGMMVHHVVIVGAGPAGLGTAAVLTSKRVPFVIVDREDCSSSLWKKRTYDRLRLHLPKRFCQLPLRPFPADYPKYPSRDQMVAYLDDYQRHFRISPVLGAAVTRAEFVAEVGVWVVTVERRSGAGKETSSSTSHVQMLFGRVLVVATGENGEAVMAPLPGQSEFRGDVIHAQEYRNGQAFHTKRVLVVGTGNSGMEVALDLANSGVQPTLVARNPFHVMPRDLLGMSLMSTFEVTMTLVKVFPVWFVDKCLVFFSWLSLGSASKYHLIRPLEGPLHMKARTGKTPVLDVGTVAKLRSGDIKVVPGVDCLTERGARFVNGVELDFDVIIMATGYASTVSKWLKSDVSMFGDNGFPKRQFPNGWKGENGLYAVGFGRKGLQGCAHDAVAVADDIAKELQCRTTLHFDEDSAN